MKQPREVKTDVKHTLEVSIQRMGHDPIIAHGTAVQCTYKNSVRLYDELDVETNRPYPFPEDRYVTMEEAGAGLVLDHRYHICPLELARASVKYRQDRFRLEDVYEHLWYCIMFLKGHFWARWNWVEVLTQPFEVQSARALSQGLETG